MTTQVWGLLGSSKIIFDRTDGNIWKVTVPFLESGEYIVALYALDDAGNQAYVATILYVVDIENIQYEIRMLDYASEAQTTGLRLKHRWQILQLKHRRLVLRLKHSCRSIRLSRKG